MLKMKKLLIILVFVLAIPLTTYAGVQTYSLVASSTILNVNGFPLTSDKPILNLDGTTYVPFRAVAEATGANVTYDPKTNVATVISNTSPVKDLDPNKISESCVQIYVNNGRRDVEQGSGVLIEYNQILTCNHVTAQGTIYRALYNGNSATGCSLKSTDSALDYSILEPVNKDVKPVKIGDSDEVKEGDMVFLISSPLQNKNVITWGKIESINNGFHVSAVGDRGSSGGALFSINGELIGIVESGDDFDKHVNVIPINNIRKAMAN